MSSTQDPVEATPGSHASSPPPSPEVPGDTVVVAIARNEGERLRRCLASALRSAGTVVYADSASSDGSAEHARALGACVVGLDASAGPLNAPRGRNAGFAHVLDHHPDARYVFFVDGDCEIIPGFLAAARAQLERDAGLGAVCGRRAETSPEASVYNRATDTEWNTPLGEAESAGGDVVVRVQALREVGGYNEALTAGEDPELGFRLRRAGWRILRIDEAMTRHDVALLRFGPWWRRHARGGYAYAHGAALHGRGPERFQVRRVASIAFWGLLVPVAALATVPVTRGASLAAGILAYGWLVLRVRGWRVRLGDDPRHATSYALLVAVGKLAEAWGLLRYLADAARGRGAVYVEYKDYQRE